MSIQLQYHKPGSIQTALWDAALQLCHNGNVYAQSIYLSTMCPTWAAITTPHMEYLMPIPIKYKLGVAYIPSIPFVQQLGIYSPYTITPSICNSFKQIIQRRLLYGDVYFNNANPVTFGVQQCNYVLPLQHSYQVLYHNFKQDAKKDIYSNPNLIIKNTTPSTAIHFFKEHIGSRIPHVLPTHYIALTHLAELLALTAHSQSIAVYSKGVLVATALLFFYNNTIYNIANAVSPEGKKIKANHQLINHIIHTYAGNKYTLDFEGSDIPGIANFYKQFGAVNVPYAYYKRRPLGS